MKILWYALSAVALLLTSATVPVSAQTAGGESAAAGPATSGRVGFVDLDRITAKAKQQAAAMDTVSDEVRRIQQDMQKKLDKMRDLEREIQKSEGVVSSDEISRKRREVNKLKDELDELELKYKRQMQRLDETVFEPLVKKIGYAIEDVAKERNFDIVLRGEAVFYGNPAVDLTEDVIKLLDRDTATTRSGTGAAKQTPASGSSSKSEAPSEDSRPAARVRPVDRQKDR